MPGSRDTIVGRITELGTHYVMVGGTRIALLDGKLTRELQLGQIITVEVDANRRGILRRTRYRQCRSGITRQRARLVNAIICRLCGEPIQGAARYREGDVHVDGREKGPARERTPRD